MRPRGRATGARVWRALRRWRRRSTAPSRPPSPPPACLQGLLIADATSTPSRRRAVHRYYLRQNDLIDALLETQAIHRGEYTNNAEEVRSAARA